MEIDDLYALIIAAAGTNDEMLAEELQLQEVLVSSFAVHSVTELGESSGTAADFDCGICMEAKPGTEIFHVPTCRHVFCESCIGRYVAAKVEENAAFVGCPDPDCKAGDLTPETCREILPAAVFDRWGVALCEAALGAEKLYCPHRDCSIMLMRRGVEGEAECPHCHRKICERCEVEWHEGVGCDEFCELREGERGRDDLMLTKLAGEKNWQRCRQCRLYVERISGCSFIVCRCGYLFCYTCGSPMSKYSHRCQNCGSKRH